MSGAKPLTGLQAAEVCIEAGLPSARGYSPQRLLRHYGAAMLRRWVEHSVETWLWADSEEELRTG